MVWGGALCSAYVIGSVETTLCVLSVEEKTWGAMMRRLLVIG